ncbi:hypothetical protein [Massilia sp. TSP1-1-2]|uniref:hypothetical protein n=1 Tax=unclassified Massilia TaxID=2609279 RepID=UPI003CFB94D9
MKYLMAFAVLALVSRLGFATGNVAVAHHKLLTWPGMNPVQFGCYVEKTFGVRDKRFNCSAKPYVAGGNPCTAADAYEEGPAFPDAAAAKIHPDIKTIDLSWEHGDLQQISVDFKRKLSRKEIATILSLPENFEVPQEKMKFIRIYIQECSSDGSCLGIQMFDHQGAGDIDCGDVK